MIATFLSFQKIRNNLIFMKKYLDECRIANEGKFIENIVTSRNYLIENSQFYSIYDLVCIENNSLLDFLNNTFQIFYKHIFNCQVIWRFNFSHPLFSDVPISILDLPRKRLSLRNMWKQWGDLSILRWHLLLQFM